MLLDSDQNLAVEIGGIPNGKTEYVLIVESDEAATVPIASYNILESKMDGTEQENDDTGTADGKAQRNGSNDDEEDIIIVIISDAFLESTNKDVGESASSA